MGYVLLWIESLAASLLFVATMVACLAQLGPKTTRWLGRGFAIATAAVGTLVLVCGVLDMFAGTATYGHLWIMAIMVTFTAGACWAWLRGPWQRVVAAFFALVPLAIYAVPAAFLAIALQSPNTPSGARFSGFILLAIVYGLCAIVVLIYGLRRQAESARVRAATWPRGRLTVSLLFVLALHLMTLWNLDLAARQQLSALRTEAGALALSVAPPRLPDRDNAAIVYQQAFEGMGRSEASPGGWQWEKQWQDAWNERWTAWQSSEMIGFDLHDPELRRFLKRQASTLALLRRAGAKPGCRFDRDYSRPSIYMLLPEVGPLRDAARLLALDAICRAADKDYRGAIENVSAMFRMAEHLGVEPMLVSQLVAIAIDGLAVSTLRHVLASGAVPVEDLRAIDFSNNTSYRAGCRRCLRMEEAFSLALFQQVGEGQIDIAIVADMKRSPMYFYNATGFASIYRLFVLGDDVATQARFAAQFDHAIGLPYVQAVKELQNIDQELRSDAGGMLTKLTLLSLLNVVETAARGDARREGARLGLALYTYRARKGKFPDKLEDLTPDFIPAVPSDPFDGQPMRYKLAGQGAIVYSIGPDMTDDGGIPFDPAELKMTSDITFFVP